MQAVKTKASSAGLAPSSRAFAQLLDSQDALAHLRQQFLVPRNNDLPGVDTTLVDGNAPCTYLCGNSLGLQPKGTRQLVDEELDKWSRRGVHGHFGEGGEKRPWVSIDETVTDQIARIVGAKPSEVAVMNTLTVNLHLLLVPFFRPSGKRTKILIEHKAFPSDHFAVESQLEVHGLNASEHMLQVHAREGEHHIRHEDIIDMIERNGDEIAVVMLSGVQFYNGQFFDLEAIAAKAHEKGCLVGFDLAHAVGNVVLKLHDWNVDFACWCTYKYLNAGPGGIAGAFIHERHASMTHMPYFKGWWGVDLSERFAMGYQAKFMPGVRGMQLSNPGVLQTVSLLGSMQVFEQTSMEQLREKSLLLTGYLELLLRTPWEDGTDLSTHLRIITPDDPQRRGCQLSLLFEAAIKPVFAELEKRGVVCDMREPNVLRVAPVPLYSTFTDVYNFAVFLKDSLQAASSAAPTSS